MCFLLVNESSVFTVEPETSFLSVFGMSDPEESLRTTAKQVNLILFDFEFYMCLFTKKFEIKIAPCFLATFSVCYLG